MRKLSQQELLDEGFWGAVKKPFKTAGAVAGGIVRGGARALDYVAPDITHPLHKFEAGVRDIARQGRRGADVGYGGLTKQYGDLLLDAGYVMDPTIKIIDSGRNKVVVGYRVVGKDSSGNPIPDKSKKLSFLFDEKGNFKIITTSAQDTTKVGQTYSPKYK